MKKLFCIGEMLIDFIPVEKGVALKDVVRFERVAGGAPMNVAIVAAKLGSTVSMLSKVAEDHFGDYLVNTLKDNGVDTSYLVFTKSAETGLAFVSVQENGERDFNFYRKNAADLELQPTEIHADWFGSGDLLHFCSVDLVDSPMKEAHRKAINSMREAGGIISFDPNIRLPLWDNIDKCKEVIEAFLPMADIVKVSEEELYFITGEKDIGQGAAKLFEGRTQAVVCTMGSKGSILFLRDNFSSVHQGYSVHVADTTGSGDAFVGAFLSKLLEFSPTIEKLNRILKNNADKILAYANASGAVTAGVRGSFHPELNESLLESAMKSTRV